MTYVDDAFANLKGQLEITKTEGDLAQRRHKEIRDHVATECEPRRGSPVRPLPA